MNNFGISDKSFKHLIKALNKANIQRALLFGSRAIGNYKKGSDIDIAVKCNDSRAASNLSAFLNQEAPIPYFIDVLDYNHIENTQLKSHIDEVGVDLINARN